MFENYLATKEDFEAIEKALKTVWSNRMNFVFKKKELIKKTVIISLDSQSLYFWATFKLPGLEKLKCNFGRYQLFKKPHKLKITEEMQKGWQAGINWKILKLPKIFRNWYQMPTINGSLLHPFVGIHRKLKNTINPYDAYTTRESYLATIVHEFAHVYYNLHKPWWFSNKKENLSYLKNALQIFEGKKEELENIKVNIPTPAFLSEVFAFCSEYYVASVHWPNHLKNINKASAWRIKRLIKLERKRNLDTQDSVLASPKTYHDTAAVIGIILLKLYPKSWPQKLLQKFTF